ncbi:LOW QUALITY PROTEIN: hypothetical protein HID58_068289 [Brassica napus]|uniref:Uncharacterized protein n=1 Tax=Brassica napus TaxID=3708 RepID=A0ABQ7ZKX7_BRANA|nr:LOW QUALITY PROTEIN: hypothetical protein HID58_068289 [Brassica napus]
MVLAYFRLNERYYIEDAEKGRKIGSKPPSCKKICRVKQSKSLPFLQLLTFLLIMLITSMSCHCAT